MGRMSYALARARGFCPLTFVAVIRRFLAANIVASFSFGMERISPMFSSRKEANF